MSTMIVHWLVPAAALVLIAASAHAQDGDAAAGYAFARQACNACHVVEAEQQAPRLLVIGPAFRDIANTRWHDRDSSTSVSYDVTPKDAEPDPHAGRDRGCQRLRSQPT